VLISCDLGNLAYHDIVMSQQGRWPLLIRTHYVCTCVGTGSGMGGGIRKIKAIWWGAYYYSLVLNAQPCKYDMYKSSLRHIHDHTWSGTFIIKDERYTFLLRNIILSLIQFWYIEISLYRYFLQIQVNQIHTFKIPYFSIDNAHLMYNTHPKLFRHSFWCIGNAHDAN
jgi:hypothetical protein